MLLQNVFLVMLKKSLFKKCIFSILFLYSYYVHLYNNNNVFMSPRNEVGVIAPVYITIVKIWIREKEKKRERITSFKETTKAVEKEQNISNIAGKQ
jgi:hypothetical protein